MTGALVDHAHPAIVLVALALALTLVASPTPARASTAYDVAVDITFPVEEHVQTRFRDDYDDCRRTGAGGCVRHHQATDLMVPLGTPVYAAMGGTVAWLSGSEAGPPSYGWMVRIAGDDGRAYAYVHLGTQDGPRSEAYAPGTEVGRRVERGQLLGWAGCSGTATCGGGEHLHFEIHDQSVVDPYDYHDHERMNPYPSLVAARARGDFPNARRFTDVARGSVHERAIDIFAQHGITRGCGARRFCPTNPVTRQQMAAFLTRALELEVPADQARFDDVPATNMFRAQIAALAEARVTRGCGPRRFCPDDAVTRAQMASFLVRALGLPPSADRPFHDVSPGNVHAADIAALAAADITRGCGTGRYCPDAPVTRAQMATFLVRALGLTPVAD